PTCVVVLADPDNPDVFEYDSRFESTHWPCDLLWGPGDPADAVEWLVGHHPGSDQVETIDRLFLIQYRGDRLILPRSPARTRWPTWPCRQVASRARGHAAGVDPTNDPLSAKGHLLYTDFFIHV